MTDETVKQAEAAAQVKSLPELEAEVAKMKAVEDKIRFAAAQKEINAICLKYNVLLTAEPVIQRGLITAVVALQPAPDRRTNGHSEG